jgi:hypothetical protein
LKFKNTLYGNVVPDLTKLTSLREIDFDQIDLLDFGFMAGSSGLRKVSISNASNLTSVNGIGGLKKLQSFSVYGCKNLTDFSTLSALNNIKYLTVYDAGPVSNLSFVKNLKRINDLSLTISSDADLSSLKDCEWIEDVTLHIRPGETLELDLEMPELQKLSLRSTSPWDDTVSRPLVKVKNLKVKNLLSLNFFGINLEDFSGICHVKDIDFYYCGIKSFTGIFSTIVEALDLRGVDDIPVSLSELASLHMLKRLTLPNDENVGRLLQMSPLSGLAGIEYLDTTGLHGSIKWLEGWNSLKELRLEKCGRLLDLDVLSKLPLIGSISFRGGVIKKDELPDSIQTKSIFK